MRSRWERLGLRARVALVFALGAIMLSVTLSLVTLTFTRQSLLDERDASALATFTLNSREIQSQLTEDADAAAFAAIMAGLTTTQGEFGVLRVGDDWFPTVGVVFEEANVPASLKAKVGEGEPARLRATIDSGPAIVSGIRLRGSGDREVQYYEAVKLDDIEDTLSTLTIILAGTGVATTVLAGFLGTWAARRTLAPIGEVRRAAESLAAGELDTRLNPPADADLASLSASFNGMAGALEDRIERDARFASEVSHELRSPLMTLSASVEVLNNSRDSMPERSQTALGLLTDDIARFSQLVEDLLEISRFDVGTAALQRQPLGVVEFVRQAVGHSSRTDASLVATPDVTHLVVSADKRRLGQVMTNLIDNADKYGEGNIEIQISRWEDNVIIAVEDEGPGVAEAERLVIFDRFSRGTSGGRRGYDTGSGLGLSLVAEHIGLHGGNVWVEDRLNGASGARFVVTLPIVEHEDDEL